MKIAQITAVVLVIVTGAANAAPVTIKDIRHNNYAHHSRIVLELGEMTPFRLIPDIENKKIIIRIPGATVSESIKTGPADKRVSVHITSDAVNGTTARIDLLQSPLSFYYFTLPSPPRIVIDIKEIAKPIQTAKKRSTGAPDKPAALQKSAPGEAKKEKEKKKTDDLQKLAAENREIKELYRDGLRLFAQENYRGSLQKLTPIVLSHPYSRRSRFAFYVIAESNFQLAQSDEKMIDRALDAYRVAISRYPDHYMREKALFRMGELYVMQGRNVEAKGTYKTLFDDYPRGKYAPGALLARARIFSSEKRFMKAYNELEKVLFLYPFSPEVRRATFKIGDSYFIEKNYEKAVEIYTNAMKKWPAYSRTDPETLYNIGESFYKLKKLDTARKKFFQVVNIFPSSLYSPKALTRLGDIYKRKGKNRESLKLYATTVSLYPEKEGADSRVRMADIGVANKEITEKENIFDYSAYRSPAVTYRETMRKFPGEEVAKTALYGMGKVFKSDNEYLKALEKFKEMLLQYPDDALKERGEKDAREMFFTLVDAYHSQEGFFPVLILYYKNFEALFTEIKNPKILFKIADSYKELGFYEKALEFYALIRPNDKKGKYTGPVMMGTAEVKFLHRRYEKAAGALKTYLKKYPKGREPNRARKLLGDTRLFQKKPKKAYRIYADFIKREPKGERAAKVYYMMAAAANMMGRHSRAVESYRKAAAEVKKLRPDEHNRNFSKNIRFEIFYSLYQGKQFKKAVKVSGELRKAYPDDENEKLVLYLTADSYRQLKNDKKSKDILTRLAGMKDGIIQLVASQEVDYLNWKKEHQDLYQ